MEKDKKKKRKKERFNSVVAVVAERKLIAAEFPAGVGQYGAAHFGTKSTGVFFPAVIEYDFSDLGFPDQKRYIKGSAKIGNRGVIRISEPVVNRNRMQGKILMRKSPIKGKGMKKKKGILSAGYAYGNPVSVFNQIEISICFPYAAQSFFHRRSSSMIRILSDCVWHR